MPFLRRSLRIGGWVLLVLAATAAVAFVRLGRDLEPGFRERVGEVAGVEASPEVEDGAFTEALVTLRSTSGLAVDLAVRRPRDPVGEAPLRRPLAILLGGHETGRDAIRLVADTRGVA